MPTEVLLRQPGRKASMLTPFHGKQDIPDEIGTSIISRPSPTQIIRPRSHPPLLHPPLPHNPAHGLPAKRPRFTKNSSKPDRRPPSAVAETDGAVQDVVVQLWTGLKHFPHHLAMHRCGVGCRSIGPRAFSRAFEVKSHNVEDCSREVFVVEDIVKA